MDKCCGKCGEEKPLEEFALNQAHANGRSNWCHVCQSQYDAERYETQRDEIIQRATGWNATHRKRANENVRASRLRKKTGLPLRVRRGK